MLNVLGQLEAGGHFRAGDVSRPASAGPSPRGRAASASSAAADAQLREGAALPCRHRSLLSSLLPSLLPSFQPLPMESLPAPFNRFGDLTRSARPPAHQGHASNLGSTSGGNLTPWSLVFHSKSALPCETVPASNELPPKQGGVTALLTAGEPQ